MVRVRQIDHWGVHPPRPEATYESVDEAFAALGNRSHELGAAKLVSRQVGEGRWHFVIRIAGPLGIGSFDSMVRSEYYLVEAVSPITESTPVVIGVPTGSIMAKV